jgi:hypothetical protein
LLFFAANLAAQAPDSLQQSDVFWNTQAVKMFLFEKDSIQLDSLPIVNGTLLIIRNNETVSANCYRVISNYLILEKGCFRTGDSLRVSYRTLPHALQQPFFNKDRKLIGADTDLGEDFVIGQGYTYNPFTQNQDFNDFKGFSWSQAN